MKILSAYFLFILKKAGERQISFDNLLENIEEDRKFLKTEIINYLSEEDRVSIIEDEKIIYQEEETPKETINTKWHITNISNETLESEFLENESILDKYEETESTSEASEENIQTYSKQFEESEITEQIELIQKNTIIEEKQIFKTPGNPTKYNKKNMIPQMQM